jgi:predicted RNA-binding protein with PIN domain
MGQLILVDGYNVIRRNPQFRAALAHSLESARQLLIAQLLQRYRHTPHQVTVVFDGAGRQEQSIFDRRIHIIYSKSGENADQVIARLASEAQVAGREVLLFSDDHEVRQSVVQQGGTARTAQSLGERLNAPPRDLALRVAHRLRMRALYGIDPAVKLADQQEPLPATRSRGRKSRRRR